MCGSLDRADRPLVSRVPEPAGGGVPSSIFFFVRTFFSCSSFFPRRLLIRESKTKCILFWCPVPEGRTLHKYRNVLHTYSGGLLTTIFCLRPLLAITDAQSMWTLAIFFFFFLGGTT